MTATPKRPYPKGFKPSLKVVETPNMTADDQKMTVMTLATPFDDATDEKNYKWSEIRDLLELGSNVANARWMPEKLMPLFANLDAPELLTDKGKPTKFCGQMLFRYKAFCIDDGNDYETFCDQVRSVFADDAPKPVRVEVLEDDSAPSPNGNHSSSSALTTMRQQIEERNDDLESRVMLALQTTRQAEQAKDQYQDLSSKSWEQEVVEDEIARFTAEQERKKREFELRAKVRQMLESQSQE